MPTVHDSIIFSPQLNLLNDKETKLLHENKLYEQLYKHHTLGDDVNLYWSNSILAGEMLVMFITKTKCKSMLQNKNIQSTQEYTIRCAKIENYESSQRKLDTCKMNKKWCIFMLQVWIQNNESPYKEKHYKAVLKINKEVLN